MQVAYYIIAVDVAAVPETIDYAEDDDILHHNNSSELYDSAQDSPQRLGASVNNSYDYGEVYRPENNQHRVLNLSDLQGRPISLVTFKFGRISF